MSDKLAPVVKKMKKVLGCKHPHLQFDATGANLKCIDCERVWTITHPQFMLMPDLLYADVSIGGQFRHTDLEPPRTSKKRG